MAKMFILVLGSIYGLEIPRREEWSEGMDNEWIVKNLLK